MFNKKFCFAAASSVRRLSTEVLRQKTLEQHGPVIQLANREVPNNYTTSVKQQLSFYLALKDLVLIIVSSFRQYLAGSDGKSMPSTMSYATSEDCDCYHVRSEVISSISRIVKD